VRFLVALAFVACAPSGPRDVTEQRRDVTTTKGQDGYEYVVKTPHGVLAIAESRGVKKDDAKQAADRLAKAFDKCLGELEQKAPLKPGAARIIVPVDDGGLVGEPQVSSVSDASPETKVTIVLCLIAPAKMMAFPPPGPASPEAGTRGMAVEATWP
jgi:hypothetical protein